MSGAYLGTYRSLDSIDDRLVPSKQPPQLAELYIDRRTSPKYQITVQHLNRGSANKALERVFGGDNDTVLRASAAICVRFEKIARKRVEHAGFCFQFADANEGESVLRTMKQLGDGKHLDTEIARWITAHAPTKGRPAAAAEPKITTIEEKSDTRGTDSKKKAQQKVASSKKRNQDDIQDDDKEPQPEKPKGNGNTKTKTTKTKTQDKNTAPEKKDATAEQNAPTDAKSKSKSKSKKKAKPSEESKSDDEPKPPPRRGTRNRGVASTEPEKDAAAEQVEAETEEPLFWCVEAEKKKAEEEAAAKAAEEARQKAADEAAKAAEEERRKADDAAKQKAAVDARRSHKRKAGKDERSKKGTEAATKEPEKSAVGAVATKAQDKDKAQSAESVGKDGKAKSKSTETGETKHKKKKKHKKDKHGSKKAEEDQPHSLKQPVLDYAALACEEPLLMLEGDLRAVDLPDHRAIFQVRESCFFERWLWKGESPAKDFIEAVPDILLVMRRMTPPASSTVIRIEE